MGEVITVYDLDQARKIIYAEMAEDRKRIKKALKKRRKERVEQIKITLVFGFWFLLIPGMMVLNWLFSV